MFISLWLVHAARMVPVISHTAHLKRIACGGLLTLVHLMPASAAFAQPVGKPLRAPISADLKSEIEAYRMCGRLNLPPDFKPVKDAETAATSALAQCSRQRFAVAGQFALDFPGTVRTRTFTDGVTTELVQELAAWLNDVQARRVPPQPPIPPRSTR